MTNWPFARTGLIRRIALRLLAAATFLFAVAAAQAEGGPSWRVDTERSRITFVGRQMGVPSEGRFEEFSGAVRFDHEALGTSRAEISVRVGSAATGNSDIDAALHGPKWFDVDSHPEARFVASQFRETGENAYEAVGQLTIKGVSQEQTVAFTIENLEGGEDGPPRVARASGEFTISRLAYNIGDDEWRDTNIVADEVVVRFEIVAVRED